MANIITVYHCTHTTTECGLKSGFLGYTSTEEAARELVKGKSYFGDNGSYTPVNAILVDGEIYLLASTTPISAHASAEEARKALAKAKLTPEELKLLNL